MSRVEESRREAEERLAAVRDALRSEIGWAPRKRTWILPIAAGAVGLAIALARSGRKRRKGPAELG